MCEYRAHVCACGRPRNRRPSCIHRGPSTRALSDDDDALVGIPFNVSPTPRWRSNTCHGRGTLQQLLAMVAAVSDACVPGAQLYLATAIE